MIEWRVITILAEATLSFNKIIPNTSLLIVPSKLLTNSNRLKFSSNVSFDITTNIVPDKQVYYKKKVIFFLIF